MSTRFLYYFFLCLCKSFKELVWDCFIRTFPESGCKGTTIFRIAKTFPTFFSFFIKKSFGT